MRSFNKLANLHSVFFKKAANPEFTPRLPAYKSKNPTQGGSELYEGHNGPLTPFTNERYNQDQVRRQLGIATAAGGLGKMVGSVAKGGISGLPGGIAAAIPNAMAAGSAFSKDMPRMARAALNAPKPVNLNAQNPMPQDNPAKSLGRDNSKYYADTPASGFGGGAVPPNKLGRP